MAWSSEQDERALRRVLDAIETWGPVCAAVNEADMAMREARFILLGGPGSVHERLEQAARVLEAGIAKTREYVEED